MSRSPHSIFNLPQDVIFDILSRLPTKSLIQFTSVCTSSPPLISHPSFTKLHLSSSAAAADDHHLLVYYESTDYINQFYSFRSPITFQESLKLQIAYKNLHGYLRIVGSNKGVICFFDTNYYSNVGMVILWNPSIKKLKKIDDPSYILDRVSHFVVGFGFVSRTCEFKIVVIVYYLDNSNTNSVSVYSLGTDSWKKKEDNIAPCYLMRGWSNNVFVNGFVNWLACKQEIRGVSHEIMAFDLEDEIFQVLELPKNIRPSYNQVHLASYGESSSLTFCAHYLELNGEKWDMWVMSDYGVVDSWRKVCVISQPMLSIPPLLMKNDNEVLIVTNDGRLMLFDVNKNEMFDLKTCGLPRMYRAINYTASLALLHG
ncbi:unnamed protein product [Lactuca saligna]|uniref:F-box domain-containing protein n=1 Tax=Lactuca saligna TaxID=75948 RepID=A0AA35VN73_LACSI|nr:unnamed protein product [Lactuca saligna]